MKAALPLVQLVLSKVSFDPTLFKKELNKGLAWIEENERPILFHWCLLQFGAMYHETILDVFDHFQQAM